MLTTLPKHITNHPFFHPNVNEKKAKELLEDKPDHTCLFIQGDQPDHAGNQTYDGRRG